MKIMHVGEGVISDLEGKVQRFALVEEGTTDIGIGSVIFGEDWYYYIKLEGLGNWFFIDPDDILEGAIEIEVSDAAHTDWYTTRIGKYVRCLKDNEMVSEVFVQTVF